MCSRLCPHDIGVMLLAPYKEMPYTSVFSTETIIQLVILGVIITQNEIFPSTTYSNHLRQKHIESDFKGPPFLTIGVIAMLVEG